MSDATFAWATCAVWAGILVFYAVRVARYGAFASERVVGVGGTVLVGQNIMSATYWAIDPVVRGLAAIGATPNLVTWSSLGCGLAAGVAIAYGWFGLACLLGTCSAIGDILDGQIARVTGGGSLRGELLDAAVDRYCEFAFIAGFIVYAREPVGVTLALFALLASSMISYASAKAETARVAVPRGLMRRHERAIFVTMGAGLTPLVGAPLHHAWPAVPATAVFMACLAIVAAIGNFAAIQRFVQISRGLPS